MQLGIIVPHLATSQLSYLVTNQVNLSLKEDFDVVLFHKQFVRPIQRVYTSVFMVDQITKFSGTLICTDFDSLNYVTKLCTPARRIYYPWNITEFFHHGIDYTQVSNLLRDPNIELICRSEFHANQIRQFNREVDAIIPDINFTLIRNYLESTQKDRFYINDKGRQWK